MHQFIWVMHKCRINKAETFRQWYGVCASHPLYVWSTCVHAYPWMQAHVWKQALGLLRNSNTHPDKILSL